MTKPPAENSLGHVLEEQGLSASDLARLLDVTRQSVGEWVRGESPIPIRRRAQIVILLKVPASRLGGMPKILSEDDLEES